MTATLDAATSARVAGPSHWRTRILPPTDGRGGWAATLLVGLIAGLLRVVRLDLPAGRIFDEVYYVCDAQNLLRFGVEAATVPNSDGDPRAAWRCEPTGEPGFIVHPPLGKWLIAIGLRLFGVDEFGWRIAAAVAGTLTVVVLVRVTRTRTTTVTVPATAAAMRQPNSSTPNSRRPIAMSHFPSGGWTMKPGSPVGSQRACTSAEPPSVAASTPKRRRFWASQT